MSFGPDLRSQDEAIERARSSYIEAALWTSLDEAEPLEDSFSLSDIDPGVLVNAQDDLRRFMVTNRATIAAVRSDAEAGGGHYGAEQTGHDFWLTRNSHGTGFWDRGLGELCDRFAQSARAAGECDLYIGDDGGSAREH